jgi:hypothetical protein
MVTSCPPKSEPDRGWIVAMTAASTDASEKIAIEMVARRKERESRRAMMDGTLLACESVIEQRLRQYELVAAE